MAMFVLIHGAWHCGWCWAKVTPLLQRAGHKAVAPDLPGHGLDTTPTRAVTLAKYVERVCDVLEAESEPVVLVGHSMGGRVITQTAEQRPERIRKLVYLTAHIPRNGESAAPLVNGENLQARMQSFRELSADGKHTTFKPEHLREVFYNDCSDEDAAWAQALLAPQAVEPLSAKLSLTEGRFGTVPRAYIECTLDNAIPLALQRQIVANTPCQQVVTLETSHSPFMSAPVPLAEALLALV